MVTSQTKNEEDAIPYLELCTNQPCEQEFSEKQGTSSARCLNDIIMCGCIHGNTNTEDQTCKIPLLEIQIKDQTYQAQYSSR